MRNRRDRERAVCSECGREVTVRRDGGLMAHRDTSGRTCVPAAWKQRQEAPKGRRTGTQRVGVDGMNVTDPMAAAIAALHGDDCVDEDSVDCVCEDTYYERAAQVVIAAVRPLIEAEVRGRFVCYRCEQQPSWLECGNMRCTVKLHPFCSCSASATDDFDNGHWCDEGCPPSAEDLKAIEAEVRERVAREIEAARCDSCGQTGDRCTGRLTEQACAVEYDGRQFFARIARGDVQ